MTPGLVRRMLMWVAGAALGLWLLALLFQAWLHPSILVPLLNGIFLCQ